MALTFMPAMTFAEDEEPTDTENAPAVEESVDAAEEAIVEEPNVEKTLVGAPEEKIIKKEAGEVIEDDQTVTKSNNWGFVEENVFIEYVGSPVTLTPEFTDIAPEGLSFQWYRWNGEWDDDYNRLYSEIMGATDESYSGVTTDSWDGEYLYVEVTDADGDSRNCYFNVYVEEVIQSRVYYRAIDAVTCYAYMHGEIDDGGAAGAMWVAPSVSFSDGKNRMVTEVEDISAYTTSCYIPDSVQDIYFVGLSDWTWNDDGNDLSSWTVKPTFTIYGKRGSAAQTYANKYGITFIDSEDIYGFGELPTLNNIEEIELNKMIDVTVDEEYPIVTFKFTPEESGFYIFESYGQGDTIGRVRTEDEIIESMDDADEEKEYNFQIAFWGEAQETYYLQAKAYDDKELSFQVKAYDVPWIAYAEEEDFVYSGNELTLEVTVEGTYDNLSYRWYRNDQLINDATNDSIIVSKGGNYYCLVSGEGRSVKIYVRVHLEDEIQDNLSFYYDLEGDYACVDAVWNNDASGSVCLTSGDITIPSEYRFTDGETRPVKEVEMRAPEVTSITIPASVTQIWGVGLSDWSYDDDDNLVNWVVKPGFVIYGTSGSYAQTYANKYGITFKTLSEKEAASKPTTTPATVTPSAQAAPTEILDLPVVKISKPKAAKKKITVKWKAISKDKKFKKIIKNVSGVQIEVATDPGFTNIVKTATASKKKASKVIKGLSPKTKYYVRIRAYAAGNHYSAWKSKSAKVK